MAEDTKFDAFHAFEHYKELSADDKARVKEIHRKVRSQAGGRAGNLAWAFVRGFPYRRVERTTRTQVMADGSVVQHHPPPVYHIAKLLSEVIPGLDGWFADKWRLKDSCPLHVWLYNPEGAIPAPPPRPKKPYVRPEGDAA